MEAISGPEKAASPLKDCAKDSRKAASSGLPRTAMYCESERLVDAIESGEEKTDRVGHDLESTQSASDDEGRTEESTVLSIRRRQFPSSTESLR